MRLGFKLKRCNRFQGNVPHPSFLSENWVHLLNEALLAFVPRTPASRRFGCEIIYLAWALKLLSLEERPSMKQYAYAPFLFILSWRS